MAQVSHPCDLIVPITVYEGLSQVHRILKNYKASSHPSQPTLRLQALAMLVHFFNLHSSCIASAAGGPWDAITTVPSTTGRSGQHPLALLVQRSRTIGHQYVEALVKGPADISNNNANDEGFIASRVSDRRVLIVDDTFTSGARAQSAASAITLAGGMTLAILPIGRYFNPSYTSDNQKYWARQTAIPFAWNVCCVH